jgi:hypothetical protein
MSANKPAGEDKKDTPEQREGVAAEFLRDVLAGGALGVPKLEAMARTAGLLGEDGPGVAEGE